MRRRELELLVNHGLHAVDDACLAQVAEIVLGKTVAIQRGKFSFKKPDATPIDPTTKSMEKTPMASPVKLTPPQAAVLLDVLAGNDRFADKYSPALKVVALGLANWERGSRLSNDRLILSDEGKARADLERAKREGK
jgi:hypothetical protein